VAQDSYPSAARASGVLTDLEYERLVSGYMPSGIIGVPTDPYPVYTAGDASRGVRFRANAAGLVLGRRFLGDATDTVISAAANASGQTRYDLACWELDRASSFQVRAHIETGTPGAGAAPAPIQTYTSTGKWQFPLAAIRVDNGASTLAADRTAKLGWWLGYPTYLTSTGAARPPAAKGQGIYEWETDSRLTGDGSSYVGPISDSHWINMSAGGGWEAGVFGLRYRRVNGVVYASISAHRIGGSLAARTASVMARVPDGYKPSVPIPLTGYVDGANVWLGHVDPNGNVLTEYYNVAIPNGATFTASAAAWPTGS
jgi:hypothetical protein